MNSLNFFNKIPLLLILLALYSYLGIGLDIYEYKLMIINLIFYFLAIIVILFQNRKITIDKISILFLILLIELLIPYYVFDFQSIHFWGNYFSFIYAFLTYIIALNIGYKKNTERTVILFVKLYAILFILSLFVNFIDIYQIGYGTQEFKKNVIINLGESNNLGFYLLLLFFIINHLKKSIFDYLILIGLFLGIIMISSRATFLSFIIVFTLLKIRVLKYRIYLVIATVIIYFSIPYVIDFFPFLAGYSTRGDISSGRFTIYLYAFNQWYSSPFFGTGLGNLVMPFMEVENIYFRPHNFILEILLGGGLCALIIFYLILKISFKSLNNIRLINSTYSGVYFGLIAVLIQGFLEPNIFNYRIDSFLWFFIGITVKQNYFLDQHINEYKSRKRAS